MVLLKKSCAKQKGFFSARTTPLLFFVVLFFSLALLFGCTETIPGVPYTVSQFVNKTTDLNYSAFVLGVYDGNCLKLDGNKITVADCNSLGGDTNWSDITGLPIGCPVGQAIRILDSDLTCVPVAGTDTNWQTSWATFDANIKAQYNLPAIRFDNNAVIAVQHADGNWNYYSSTDSNTARGTALINAFNARRTGDKFYLSANVFDLQDGNIALPEYGSLIGTGKYATIIKGSAQVYPNVYGNPIVGINHYTTIRDLSVVGYGALGDNNIHAPIGKHQGAGGAIGVLLENIYIRNTTDGIYINTPDVAFQPENKIEIQAINIYIDSNWDTINFTPESGKLQVYDSTLYAHASTDISQGDYATGIISNFAIIEIYDTNIIATDSNAFTKGISCGTSKIYLYSGRITTSSTRGGTILDLSASAGCTFYVTSQALFDYNKVSGTIVKLDNNSIMRSLISLPNASASTYFRGDGNWSSISLTDTNTVTAGWTNSSGDWTGKDLNVYGRQIYDSNLTSGRVVYSGTSGVLKDDLNFYYNDTNDRLSIAYGTNPLARIHTVKPNTNTDYSGPYPDAIRVDDPSGFAYGNWAINLNGANSGNLIKAGTLFSVGNSNTTLGTSTVTGSRINGYNVVNRITSYNATYIPLAMWKYTSASTAPYFVISSKSSLSDGNADIFILTSDGNFGLGTLAPITKADVNGSLYVRGDIIVNPSGDIKPKTDSTTGINIAQADGTDFMTFDTTNKRVGVGTGTIYDQFSVSTDTSGGVGGVALIRNGAAKAVGNTAELRFKTTADFTNTYYSARIVNVCTDSTYNAGDLAFYLYKGQAGTAGGEERMRIKNDGNIGIGTSNPKNLLNVAGDVNATGKLISDSNQLCAGGVCYYIPDLNITGNSIDTNWETSWATFDANMKTTYPTITNVSDWIDGNLATTTFYPDRNTFSGGTIIDSNIGKMKYYDDVAFAYREGAGADPLDVNIYFTGLTSFNEIVLREYYLGSSSHNILIRLWDFEDSHWEEYGSFVGQAGYTISTIPVYDPADHISDTNVILNLHHVQTGISSHYLYIDFAWLIQGIPISATPDLNGYAKYGFGYNNFSGNGNFYTTGDINAKDINATGKLISDSNLLCAGKVCYNIPDLNAGGGGGGGETLAQTLALGNVTGGNDVSFDTDGDVIIGNGQTSIDPYNRTLNNDAGTVLFSWSSGDMTFTPMKSANGKYRLSDSTIEMNDDDISFNTNGSVISDGSNTSIDPYNRKLHFSDGTEALDYSTSNNIYVKSGLVMNTGYSFEMSNSSHIGDGSAESIDPSNRYLYDSGGSTVTVNWNSKYLQGGVWNLAYDNFATIGSSYGIDFPSGAVIRDGANTSIDPYNRTLNDYTGSSIFNWYNSAGYIYTSITGFADASAKAYLDTSRQLIASDGSDSILDWSSSGTANFNDSTITTTGSADLGSSVEADAYTVGGTSGVTDTYDDGVDTQITFTSGIATAISTAYDETLMSNIKYLGIADPKTKLMPISFTWNATGLKQFGNPLTVAGKTQYGYLAQDVNKFYPECIIKTFLKEMQDINKTMDYNVTEKVEVLLADAFEKISVPIMRDVNKTEYYLDYNAMGFGADAEEVLLSRTIIVKEPTGKTKTITQLKSGVSFDSETGTFWKNETTIQQRIVTTRTQTTTTIPVITYNKNCVTAKLAAN